MSNWPLKGPYSHKISVGKGPALLKGNFEGPLTFGIDFSGCKEYRTAELYNDPAEQSTILHANEPGPYGLTFNLVIHELNLSLLYETCTLKSYL